MEADPLYGRPWKISGRFNTFKEADKKRKKLQKEENLQVKVKKLLENYVVKTRSTIVHENRNKSKRRNKNFYKKQREAIADGQSTI
tara:strand:- start:1059 stop:1316 length:258 start_codon:yes stop_codon:yes gene_type:complete